MKMTLFIIPVVSTMLLLACSAEKPVAKSGDTHNLSNISNNCPNGFFDKSAVIFNAISICGTSGVTDGKLTHAANVTAQWLDNDQDGVADEPKVIKTLKQQNPVVIMSKSGFTDSQMDSIFTQLDGRPGQDLSADETKPVGGRRDASQEEIHHIIMNAGWIKMLPATFSDQPATKSKLFNIWKFANDNKHYAYGDPTCNDACKVTEFVYLATAAYLGSDADLVSDEMMLKNKTQLQTTIPNIINLFESTDYNYPKTAWPNGNYGFKNNIKYSNQ